MIEISRGAEGVVYRYENKIVKIREVKKYRIEEIERMISKARTKSEETVLKRLGPLGVAPKVLEKSEDILLAVEKMNERIGCTVVMEYLEGERLAEVVRRVGTEKELEDLVEKISRRVSEMHRVEVVHGDLTPNNILVKDGEVMFIDFGLSKITKKPEDKAVDLYLFEKSIKAITGRDVSEAVERGYGKDTVVKDAVMKDVIVKLKDVRRRGRKRELEAIG